MKNDLINVKNILESFINQICKRKEIFKSIEEGFEELKNIDDIDRWTREECYIWINAEPYYNLKQKNNKKLKIPDCFYEPASKFYDEWDALPIDIKKTKEFKPPKKHEESEKPQTLLEYLHDLHRQVSTKEKLSLRWKASLRSFVDHIRKNYLSEESGFIDIIFPRKMDFFHGKVIRKIPLETYSIDILDTMSILKQLAFSVLNGRPNFQHSAAETLAYAWVCLICANEKTITKETLLYIISINCLKVKKTPKENIFFDECDYYSDTDTFSICIPTLFYEEEIIISKSLYNYLLALCKINQGKLFNRSLKKLRDTLNNIIKKTTLSAKPNEISFLTFLSMPHDHIGYRYRPKNKNS